MSPRDHARNARCIVIKVGSAILAGPSGVRGRVVREIAGQVADLRKQGRRVVIVSSGAIAAGSRELGWDHTGRTIPEKQAAAAVGQISLCEIYRRRFARYGHPVGQVLVTHMGLAERERFLNARHTLTELLDLGVVPIVNENDTVATEEIRFGDNDNLSAAIVNLVGADLLLILTDVDGLYAHPPEAGAPKPPIISEVLRVDADTRHRAGGSGGAFGRGGMITKLEAAERAARSGAATVLCSGRRKGAILRAAAGENIGTIIAPGTKLQSKKHWLAFTARTRGRLELDDGAIRALREGGRSLLPAGVRTVSGNFGIGDPVACADARGTEIARGLVAYSAEEIERIRGGKAHEIASVLGYSNGDEVIHRNDLVWLGSEVDRASPTTDEGS